MLLSHADLIAAEREYCRRSLVHFIRRGWSVLEPGQPYVHGWHMDAIGEHLEAVHYGWIKRLLINVPPGTMKSLATNVFFPAWEWGPRGCPSMRFIGASHEESLAIRDALKMRRLVTSYWYRTLWPEVQLVGDQKEKKNFENSATGWRQACPVKSMTGKRGDRVAWDDPHSVEDQYSKPALETARRVFRETLPTRLNDPKESAIVVVMQRLNTDDISGEILSGDYGYEHLCLPMEYEPRVYVSSIGFEDPRKEPGELLFPERFPPEVVERDKKIMGPHATAGQFQQRPAPLGGGVFKDDYWRYYDKLPALLYRKIFADTAQKIKERHDYSVFECWGYDRDGNAYLIDLLRGKWEAPELITAANAFWAKHQAATTATLGRLRAMAIEDKSSGTGLIQSLKRGDSATGRKKIPVVEISRGRDKYLRALDAAPTISAGMVWLPREAPWLSDLLEEARSFPNGAHDDQLDPLMDAIEELNPANLDASDRFKAMQ